MKVLWSNRAERGLRQVEEYILNEFGEDTRSKFMSEVEHISYLLETSPEIGNLDSLFTRHQIAYRSIVIHRLSKLVYYIKGDSIHIAAFWDTRREPKKQAGKLK